MPTKDVPPIWVSCSTTRLFRRSAFFLIASLFVLSGCGSTTQITTSAESHRPDIFGDYVVWTDYRNGNADIYLYEISSGTETQITDEAAEQVGPRVSGDYVVWQDRRNGNWDIYLFDLWGASSPAAGSTRLRASVRTIPRLQARPPSASPRSTRRGEAAQPSLRQGSTYGRIQV